MKSGVEPGSPRAFGMVFATVFALIGLYPLVFLERSSPQWVFLGLAALMLSIAMVVPHVLQPLNKCWFRFGLLVSKVMNPLILGIIFFGLFTPMSLLMRLIGRDALSRKFLPVTTSYWLERTEERSLSESLKDPF